MIAVLIKAGLTETEIENIKVCPRARSFESVIKWLKSTNNFKNENMKRWLENVGFLKSD